MSSVAVKQDEVSTALPTKTVPCIGKNDSFAERQDDETRGEVVTVKREEDTLELRDHSVQNTKKYPSPGQVGHSSKRNVPSQNHQNNNKNHGSHHSQPQHHQVPQRYNNPPMHPSMGPGPGSRVPFPMGRGYGGPPPYGYPGGQGNYPPPPHFHHPHAPHHHHQHMMGPGGPYHHGGPGPYGGMKGNFPPMGPYGGGPPGPYGMPQYPPPHHSSMNPNFGNMNCSSMGPSSSNDSISSKSSMNSKKKRTIDGMQGNMMMQMQNPFPFRRTDSTTSTTSTVTCGNNTSSETHGDDSHRTTQNNNDDTALGSLNMDGMMFGDHRSQGQQPKTSMHRRELSGASTASTLSVGGFSLASYERGNGEHHLRV